MTRLHDEMQQRIDRWTTDSTAAHNCDRRSTSKGFLKAHGMYTLRNRNDWRSHKRVLQNTE